MKSSYTEIHIPSSVVKLLKHAFHKVLKTNDVQLSQTLLNYNCLLTVYKKKKHTQDTLVKPLNLWTNISISHRHLTVNTFAMAFYIISATNIAYRSDTICYCQILFYFILFYFTRHTLKEKCKAFWMATFIWVEVTDLLQKMYRRSR